MRKHTDTVGERAKHRAARLCHELLAALQLDTFKLLSAGLLTLLSSSWVSLWSQLLVLGGAVVQVDISADLWAAQRVAQTV